MSRVLTRGEGGEGAGQKTWQLTLRGRGEAWGGAGRGEGGAGEGAGQGQLAAHVEWRVKYMPKRGGSQKKLPVCEWVVAMKGLREGMQGLNIPFATICCSPPCAFLSGQGERGREQGVHAGASAINCQTQTLAAAASM